MAGKIRPYCAEKKQETSMKKYLKDLKKIPASVLSDVMNKMNSMEADVRPLQKNVNMAGVAFTVKAMAGGNWGTHKALTRLKEGEVLVVDARGHVNTAVWGMLQTAAAIKRKAAGVVIDGSIRDSREILRSGLPVFCKGITPAGPHKGWNDDVQVQVQCGGVPVNPGDFVKGDDDGVVIIPRGDIEKVIRLAYERIKTEKEWFARLKKGQSSFDILGLKD
jgi:4-hydroxy-4-methyl-2-oxoglutarate aldolase